MSAGNFTCSCASCGGGETGINEFSHQNVAVWRPPPPPLCGVFCHVLINETHSWEHFRAPATREALFISCRHSTSRGLFWSFFSSFDSFAACHKIWQAFGCPFLTHDKFIRQGWHCVCPLSGLSFLLMAINFYIVATRLCERVVKSLSSRPGMCYCVNIDSIHCARLSCGFGVSLSFWAFPCAFFSSSLSVQTRRRLACEDCNVNTGKIFYASFYSRAIFTALKPAHTHVR